MWGKENTYSLWQMYNYDKLALTQLYYSATILNYPIEETLGNIKKIIISFLQRKRDRIKRDTLTGKIVDAGVGMGDAESIFKSLKAIWIECFSKKEFYNENLFFKNRG